MSIISLASPKDLEEMTLCIWLFWFTIFTIFISVRSTKKILNKIIVITAGIVQLVISVVILIAVRRKYPNLLDTIFAENSIYVDILAYLGIVIIISMDSYKPWKFNCWSLVVGVLGFYVMLRSWTHLGFLVPWKFIDDEQKFKWLLINFFIVAPIISAVGLINTYVIVKMKQGEENKTDSASSSQSSDSETKEAITFPIDEIITEIITSLQSKSLLFKNVGVRKDLCVA